MASSGYAYVPAACAAGQSCKLHVAFHGCLQSASVVGTAYYQNAGYNRWADTNKIIVLYPQAAIVTANNPGGCWDWWGYDDVNFPRQERRADGGDQDHDRQDRRRQYGLAIYLHQLVCQQLFARRQWPRLYRPGRTGVCH
jgi:hypothetical protein